MSATTPPQKSESDDKDLLARADPKTVKRAQWEGLSFQVEGTDIRVTNGSYADPQNHTYTVRVENSVPVACECKADTYRDGPCKHRVACAIREPVLEAAQREAIPDGGRVGETCGNGQQGCCGPDGAELPCFECYLESDR